MIDIGVLVFQTGYSVDPALLAKRAEDLGFESFWAPELPIIPVEAPSRSVQFPYPDWDIRPSYGNVDHAPSDIPPNRLADPSAVVDPFVALSRASAVTSTIKLGTGICLAPERNPLLLAKQVATLDQFSCGRFMFGIGAGGLRDQ